MTEEQRQIEMHKEFHAELVALTRSYLRAWSMAIANVRRIGRC